MKISANIQQLTIFISKCLAMAPTCGIAISLDFRTVLNKHLTVHTVDYEQFTTITGYSYRLCSYCMLK